MRGWSVFVLAGIIACNVKESYQYEDHACDDGKTGIEIDLHGDDDWKCTEDRNWPVSQWYEENQRCYQLEHAFHVCMDQTIDNLYTADIPHSGPHRKVWAQYGEYNYLPPGRYVHNLEHDAVVFMYHPCAPKDQVNKLRLVATSCLSRYILTAFPKLTRQFPFAAVTYGCVFRMSQVNSSAVKSWVRGRFGKSPEPDAYGNGQYNHGLLVPAIEMESYDYSDPASPFCPDSYENIELTNHVFSAEQDLTKIESHSIVTPTIPQDKKKYSNPYEAFTNDVSDIGDVRNIESQSIKTPAVPQDQDKYSSPYEAFSDDVPDIGDLRNIESQSIKTPAIPQDKDRSSNPYEAFTEDVPNTGGPIDIGSQTIMTPTKVQSKEKYLFDNDDLAAHRTMTIATQSTMMPTKAQNKEKYLYDYDDSTTHEPMEIGAQSIMTSTKAQSDENYLHDYEDSTTHRPIEIGSQSTMTPTKDKYLYHNDNSAVKKEGILGTQRTMVPVIPQGKDESHRNPLTDYMQKAMMYGTPSAMTPIVPQGKEESFKNPLTDYFRKAMMFGTQSTMAPINAQGRKESFQMDNYMQRAMMFPTQSTMTPFIPHGKEESLQSSHTAEDALSSGSETHFFAGDTYRTPNFGANSFLSHSSDRIVPTVPPIRGGLHKTVGSAMQEIPNNIRNDFYSKFFTHMSEGTTTNWPANSEIPKGYDKNPEIPDMYTDKISEEYVNSDDSYIGTDDSYIGTNTTLPKFIAHSSGHVDKSIEAIVNDSPETEIDVSPKKPAITDTENRSGPDGTPSTDSPPLMTLISGAILLYLIGLLTGLGLVICCCRRTSKHSEKIWSDDNNGNSFNIAALVRKIPEFKADARFKGYRSLDRNVVISDDDMSE